MSTFRANQQQPGGGKPRKNSNFAMVPADDHFRNYMSRKIELQRKQFGLVVPPPPPPSPPKGWEYLVPSTISKSRFDGNDKGRSVKRSKSRRHSPQFPSGPSENNNESSLHIHQEKDRSTSMSSPAVQSVSQVLNNLKQRHARHGSSSRKKKTKPERNRSNDSKERENQYHNSLPLSQPTSVLGVLGSLQKKHGYTNNRPSKKRKRVSRIEWANSTEKNDIIDDVRDDSGNHGVVLADSLVDSSNSSCLLHTQRDEGDGNDPCVANDVNDEARTIEMNTPSDQDQYSYRTPQKKCLPRRMNGRTSTLSTEHPRPQLHGDAIFETPQFDTPDCIAKQAEESIEHQHQQQPLLSQFTQPSPPSETSEMCTNHEDSPHTFHSPLHEQIEESDHKQHPMHPQHSTHNSDDSPNPPSSPQRQPPTNTKLKHRPDLFFTGITILINGHTTPDATTLQRLLHKHGGDLEKYETRRVTHIIAERLSTAKANIYKRQKKPIPVVRPEWIMRCVEERRLVPFGEYLVELVWSGVGGLGTRREVEGFTKFFRRKSQEKKDEQKKEDSIESTKACLAEDDLRGSVQSDAVPNAAKEAIHEKGVPHCMKQNNSAKQSKSIENKEDATQPNSKQPRTNSMSRWSDKPPSQANYQLNGQVRTVGNDPNFLESYFSSSRLSYIGSFKQRVKSNNHPNKLNHDNSSNPTAAAASGASQRKSRGKRLVLLVDMDCFFASVALRKYPQYRDQPVAVGHATSNHTNPHHNLDTKSSVERSKNSSSELSTCNYIARSYGIRKGMFLGDAIQKCPSLVVLPYDFEGFEQVSSMVAEILGRYAEKYDGCVEQVSCDESYVEVHFNGVGEHGRGDVGESDSCSEFAQSLAEKIRADIFEQTQCTASIGVGPNKFLAKLAADKVKPNASHVVKDYKAFLDGVNLRDIPGIGRKFQRKLEPHSLRTVNDVWDLGEAAETVVGGILGQGTAKKIVQFCNGIDQRAVTPAVRKTIGAECNYGVRFNGPYGVDHMMAGLAKEVEKRMIGAGVRGSKLVLKIMKSRDPTKVPGKFLGHGSCDSLSRSVDIPLTRDCEVISSAGMKVFEKLGVDKHSIRGMGLVMSSLKNDSSPEKANTSPTKLSAWLKKDDSKRSSNGGSDCDAPPVEGLSSFACAAKRIASAANDNNFIFEDKTSATPRLVPESNSNVPTFSQLDQDVLHDLPEDIQREVFSMYGQDSNRSTGVENTTGNGLEVVEIVESPESSSLEKCEEFIVPPMSQIDLEEVMELPSPIREKIMREIDSRKNGLDLAVRSPPANESKPSPRKSSLSSPKSKHARSGKKADKSIQIAGQVSVKRMLKLASIKNGDTEYLNTSFPLSQLDCLPLEVQLQIANGDDVQIPKHNLKTIPGRRFDAHSIPQQPNDTNERSHQNSVDVNVIHHLDEALDPPIDFYKENILPIKNYISSNPHPGKVEVDRLKEFLSLCIGEKRVQDVVTLLRMIKNMKHGWDYKTYLILRDAAMEEIFAFSGNKLDVAWLGL